MVIAAEAVPAVTAASAVFNSSSGIMVAALKFFLGQDQAADGESDDDDDEEDFKAVQPTKADVYKANNKVCSAAPAVQSCRHALRVQESVQTLQAFACHGCISSCLCVIITWCIRLHRLSGSFEERQSAQTGTAMG